MAKHEAWEQFDRLRGTRCKCGHDFEFHGNTVKANVCWVSRCECELAVPESEVNA